MARLAQAPSVLLSGLLLWLLCTWSVALSCDSCGGECTSACGTRNFRACCFNYLRKRSGGPGLRLELVVLPELAKYSGSLKPQTPSSYHETDDANGNNQMKFLYD